VSDIREDRPALDQITKADFSEDVPDAVGAMEEAWYKASLEGLVSKLPAADSNMPLLKFDADKLVDQSRACDSGYEASNDQKTAGTDTVMSQSNTSEKVLHGASRDQAKQSTLDLDLLTPADWRVLRAARLQALLNSPYAFTSTYARESGLSEPEWRQLFNSAVWIVARDAKKLVGLARSVGEPKRPTRHVESIWVAPTHRRRGVFCALLLAIAETERGKGVTDLLLWVLEDNYAAQRAYEALGFKPTGERQFLPAMRRFERHLQVGIRRLQEFESTARGFGVRHNGTELDQRPSFQLQELHSLSGAARTVDAV
jgi:ribosomal protein S18 acetylase RimI-like enzyme